MWRENDDTLVTMRERDPDGCEVHSAGQGCLVVSAAGRRILAVASKNPVVAL